MTKPKPEAEGNFCIHEKDFSQIIDDDGGLWSVIVIHPYSGCHEEYIEPIESFHSFGYENGDYRALEIHFKLTDVLDSEIYGESFLMDGKRFVDIEQKHKFEKMRVQLEHMISKIDSIKYS